MFLKNLRKNSDLKTSQEETAWGLGIYGRMILKLLIY